MRIAITADLHWGGARGRGDAATRRLAAFLHDRPPDLLILAGDIGAGDDFGPCLELFADLSCRKALVPGNHDIWVTDSDGRGDSLRVYREHLPQLSAAAGFHYLDAGPLLLDADLAVVGSMNWYDYSWALDALKQWFPDELERLQSKRFSQGGRHNDVRFVRWPLDDLGFTAEAVAAFERHLDSALTQTANAIVVTHHPPLYGLNFPNERDAPPGEPPMLDRLLWEAFSGNRALEEVLMRHAARIPFVFCGHTHRARENTVSTMRGYNVGGDYHFKRLLLLDWPAGTVEEQVFDHPDAG